MAAMTNRAFDGPGLEQLISRLPINNRANILTDKIIEEFAGGTGKARTSGKHRCPNDNPIGFELARSALCTAVLAESSAACRPLAFSPAVVSSILRLVDSPKPQQLEALSHAPRVYPPASVASAMAQNGARTTRPEITSG